MLLPESVKPTNESILRQDSSGGRKWHNPVVAGLLDELDEWRAALPIVLQLLHPKLRTAQWQKVFATVPPPQHLLDAVMERDLELEEPELDFEAVRKRAAEEMARQRAPGTMCLKLLWEHGLRTFVPAIAKQLELTLQREKSLSAQSTSPNSKNGSPRKRNSSRRAAIMSKG